jgi:hypothetical protein
MFLRRTVVTIVVLAICVVEMVFIFLPMIFPIVGRFSILIPGWIGSFSRGKIMILLVSLTVMQMEVRQVLFLHTSDFVTHPPFEPVWQLRWWVC